MIGTRARTVDNFRKVRTRQEAGTVESLGHAGALTRKIVQHSIRRSKKPAAPGQPPKTRKGQLRKSILYDVDKQADSVIIGPSANLISRIGSSHEFGGTEPPKKLKKPHPGGRLAKEEIGGHGPIAVPGGAKYIRIRTARQLAAVRRTVRNPNADLTNVTRARRMSRKIRTYPKRPFMGPGLQEVTPRLPKMWAGSVQ